MRVKGKKATISITLPPELVKKARELGLNISKISENALKDYIKRLEGYENHSNPNSVPSSVTSNNISSLVLRPGFEPGSPARKAGILSRAIFGRQQRFYRSPFSEQ